MNILDKLFSFDSNIFKRVGEDTIIKRLLRMFSFVIVEPILLIMCLILMILMIAVSPFIYLFTGENILENL